MGMAVDKIGGGKGTARENCGGVDGWNVVQVQPS